MYNTKTTTVFRIVTSISKSQEVSYTADKFKSYAAAVKHFNENFRNCKKEGKIGDVWRSLPMKIISITEVIAEFY